MCLIKIYLTNHTIYLTLIHFNSELYCLSISSSSLLPTICHVQASSRCARPKYALHAPSFIKEYQEKEKEAEIRRRDLEEQEDMALSKSTNPLKVLADTITTKILGTEVFTKCQKKSRTLTKGTP